MATPSTQERKYLVIGGAGFIGSHIVDHLLRTGDADAVTVFDNFSSGRDWHLAPHAGDRRLRIVRGDVKDLDALRPAMEGHGVIVHLASNPDIARAMTDPDVDFREGTLLTKQVVEAMRLTGPKTKTVLYASGSGVYGEIGDVPAREDGGARIPISTYGASKLAGEALVSSYCHMFNFRGFAFRFANVVGPRQTHGVGFDFVKRLLADPTRLRILGDGTQSKPYIHVSDIVAAVFTVYRQAPARHYGVYNVAPPDHLTVKDIADLAVECVGLRAGSVRYEYTGGDRGWQGDVPVFRLNVEKVRGLGWTCRLSSREAIRDALQSMIRDMKDGRM
jgi:UDP-glucose 4-epimerase